MDAPPPREPQWHDREKICLLAEIIKTHATDPGFLLGVLNNLRVQNIRWEDVVLPTGRTLSSCRYAFDDLRRQYSAYPSQSPPGPYTPQLGSASSLKRQLPADAVAGPAGAYQAIAPKPPQASGSYGQPPVNEPPAKRKRGRPPKALVQQRQEARAREAAARAPLAPSPLLPTPAPAQSVPVPRPRLEDPRLEPPPPLTRMPISAVLTPAPKSASQSSSSSGKKRRGRSSRSEVGPARDAPLSAQDYGSPVSRRNDPAPPDDSLARTPSLRQRDEPGPELIRRYTQAAYLPPTTRPPGH